MANQEHLERLKQGSYVWNTWRRQWRDVQPNLNKANLSRANLFEADLNGASLKYATLNETDLRKAILSYANLFGADLFEADLTEADLRGANLAEADLRGANLTGANLAEADLTKVNLFRADLSYSNLSYVNLFGANLTRTILSGANLTRTSMSEALIWYTIFVDVDLSTVQELATMKHLGPSSIGIDTLYRSHGKIPERFLRDAGIPDSFLNDKNLLVRQADQYFTCFISHSHHDQRFCDRLYADLRHHDVPSWYFPEDATWGKTVWGEIDRSIKTYDKLVVVCSEHSLQSPAVQHEIERALQREDREGKHILFPLRIDNYLFEHWEHERKADVVSKVAGDFRGWESSPKNYDKSFQRFLQALNAQEGSTA